MKCKLFLRFKNLVGAVEQAKYDVKTNIIKVGKNPGFGLINCLTSMQQINKFLKIVAQKQLKVSVFLFVILLTFKSNVYSNCEW